MIRPLEMPECCRRLVWLGRYPIPADTPRSRQLWTSVACACGRGWRVEFVLFDRAELPHTLLVTAPAS